MKMKYFRFLYYETGACLAHFGELEDTAEKKKFSFLYLRGTKKLVNQMETEHTLFLCPNYVDLVVLGQADRKTEAALRGLLKHMKVGTLVLPAKAAEENPDGVEQVVRLKTQEKLRLGGTEGWSILITCWTEGALAMLHGMNRQDQENDLFEDCVMNVKRLDCSRRCSRMQEMDGYGCALGCVLRQDFDVCKYRDKDQAVMSLNGTVLTAGEGSAEEWKTLAEMLYEEGVRIRFFALQNPERCGWWELLRNRKGRSEPKRYYIGSESEMSDRLIAALCKDGFNQIPVALQADGGICCSGLLKYKEAVSEIRMEAVSEVRMEAV